MSLSFLDRFRPQRPAQTSLVFDGLAQVRGYWEGLRQGDTLPARAAIDPRGLSGVLDRVFLAERIGRGLVQVRIAGSGLADFAGMDVRGLPLSCLFAAESRPQLAATVERVFAEPAVAELDLGSDRAAGGGLVARLLLLPLADESGTKLILGAISFAPGPTARCKLQIRSWRDERLPRAPIPPTEAPVVQPIRRVGHLSLVHVSE
ncbi:PAS domain-containing protein [Tabrizicola sp.]|uniref:PAS domain-containing protein n=1 Tax=Tabrizicola sp. TaxID=2005166 RepID=UPI0027331E39|nr:PAS domain-containing protein [Tabrizicola sp.]MDP3196522.1 PAS domain-containing protein [Tabrizicola sp.]